MSLASILIAILSFIIVLVIFRYLLKPKDAKIIKDAQTGETIAATDLDSSSTNNCAYSLWFFVNDYSQNYGKEKTVLHHVVTDDGIDGVMVNLAANSNDLLVAVKLNTKHKVCEVKNIPIQKWIHLVVSIHGRTIDIYMNGKLVRSCLANDVPDIGKLTENPVKIGKTAGSSGTTRDISTILETNINDQKKNTFTGWSGYFAKFEYYPEAVDPQTVYYLYRAGYGGGSFLDYLNRYQVKVALLDNETEDASFTF
jgi:hypothetical protein